MTYLTRTDSTEWKIKMLWREIDRKGYGTDEDFKRLKKLQEEVTNE